MVDYQTPNNSKVYIWTENLVQNCSAVKQNDIKFNSNKLRIENASKSEFIHIRKHSPVIPAKNLGPKIKLKLFQCKKWESKTYISSEHVQSISFNNILCR